MALPLLVIPPLVGLVAYGTKKAHDAHKNFEKAESINNASQKIYKKAKFDLIESKHSAKEYLDYLGDLKLSIYEQSVIPFVNSFQKIKEIDFDDSKIFALNSNLVNPRESFLGLKNISLSMQEIVSAGASSIGAGGLAGLAAYGSVGIFGMSSTGTAIAGLSGAAATNATLAWLGGGSLAAGGLGIAGGTAILGGIIAAPILAIGGMVAAGKAEEAKEIAYTNLSEARLLAEQMEMATVKTTAIAMRLYEVSQVLYNLNSRFSPILTNLQELTDKNQYYPSYSVEERQSIQKTLEMAVTLKNFMEIAILTKDGEVSSKSNQIIEYS